MNLYRVNENPLILQSGETIFLTAAQIGTREKKVEVLAPGNPWSQVRVVDAIVLKVGEEFCSETLWDAMAPIVRTVATPTIDLGAV